MNDLPQVLQELFNLTFSVLITLAVGVLMVGIAVAFYRDKKPPRR